MQKISYKAKTQRKQQKLDSFSEGIDCMEEQET